MRYHKKLAILVAACGALVSLLFLLLPSAPEPRYEGRKLSDWLEAAGQSGMLSEKFNEVVQAVGTNGIPFYTRWMRYEPGLFKRAKFRVASVTPRWIGFKRPSEDASLHRTWGSVLALRLLGERATSAIPELYAWATNVTGRDGLIVPGDGYPIDLLGRIGPAAVPAYLSLMTSPDPRVRWMALSEIRLTTNMVEHGSILTQIQGAFADSNHSVRIAATNTWQWYEKFLSAQRIKQS
jgi:hypothetical protein